MHLPKLIALGCMAVISSDCYSVEITDHEADAFISAYSLDVANALVSEEVSIRTSLGQFDSSSADCIQKKLIPGDIFQRVRPSVKESFRSAESLREATNFFLSPTGRKLAEFGKTTLIEYMRAKAKGQEAPPQPPIPPSFSEQDIVLANEFNGSASGTDFNNFVKVSLPKLKAGEKLRQAAFECINKE